MRERGERERKRERERERERVGLATCRARFWTLPRTFTISPAGPVSGGTNGRPAPPPLLLPNPLQKGGGGVRFDLGVGGAQLFTCAAGSLLRETSAVNQLNHVPGWSRERGHQRPRRPPPVVAAESAA